MQYRGINYDTGTKTITGNNTRIAFSLDAAEKEIDIIKNELHCNAIRICGCDLERVVDAAKIALRVGLTVWFSPSIQYENKETTLDFVIKSSIAAEKLRVISPNIIFVTGTEFTLFSNGFVKGDSVHKRLKNMFGPLSILKNALRLPRSYNNKLNRFLSLAADKIKEHFHGQITYASGTWEKVNWDKFDIIGVDLYRAAYNKVNYEDHLQSYLRLGKRLSIMEFGCCAYKGAEDAGPMGWAIVDWKKNKPEVKGDHTRDEGVQEKYIVDLLSIFQNEEVFAAFAFTFITGNYIHDEDPKYDLDMGSFGIVKALSSDKTGYKNLHWIPKRAFFSIASFYGSLLIRQEDEIAV